MVAKLIRYGLFFSAFTTLIVFRYFWSPTNFGKVIVFRVIIEVVFALWLVLWLKNKVKIPKPDLIGWALLGFVSSYLISSFLGSNFNQSIWGGFERMGGAFNLLHYFLFFIILISFFRTKEDWLTLLNLCLVAGLFSILYGFLQLSSWSFILGAGQNRSRIFGTIGNPAMFAGYLLFVFYLSLFLISLSAARSRNYWFYFGLAVLSAVAIFMTAVRGAVLALILSLLIYLTWQGWIHIQKKAKINQSMKVKIIVIVFTVVFGLLYFGFGSRFTNRIFSFNLQQVTVQQRILVWKEAWRGFKERPLLGWGPENFTLVHEKYFEPRIYNGPAGSIFDRPHNVVLEVLVTQGLIGLAAYLFLWLSISIFLFKKYRNYSSAVVIFSCLFIAYGIQSLFFFDSFSSYLMLTIVLAFLLNFEEVLKVLPVFETIADNDLNQKPNKFTNVFAVIIIFLTSYAIYLFSVQSILANTLSAKAAIDFSNNDYTGGMKKWEKALSYKIPRPYLNDILFNVQPVFIDAIYRNRVIPKDQLKRDLDYVLDQSSRAIANNPGYAEAYAGYNNLNLAYVNFVDSSKLDRSADILEKAVKIAPNLPSVWLELGNVYGMKRDITKTIESFEMAYQLNPDYGLSQLSLAKAYVAGGQKEKGFDLAIDSFKHNFISQKKEDLFWLGTQLKNSGQNEKLIDLLGVLSDEKPEYLIYLAIAHKDAGNINQSKKVANQLLNYEKDHPGKILDKNIYGTLAELYKYFGDIKKRTRALEKSGFLPTL